MDEPAPSATIPAKSPSTRQAVILIHGIGEQIPMETLRSFVEAVWETDPELTDPNERNGDTGEPRATSGRCNPVWTRPDDRNRSFELRRITTESDRNNRRTDFYEYYWAHLMHGSTIEQVRAWVTRLLLRSPRYLTPSAQPAWWLVWALIAALAGLAIYTVATGRRDWLIVVPLLASGVTAGLIYGRLQAPLRKIGSAFVRKAIAALLALLAFAVLAGLTWLFRDRIAALVAAPGLALMLAVVRKPLVSYVGDVVRYLRADPVNVARRQEIRERGVTLLETLMGVEDASLRMNRVRIACGQKPVWRSPYERIIIVGHSLGTIVAYDLLKFAFARINMLLDGGKPDQPARVALETYIREGQQNPRNFKNDEFQRLQSAALQELRNQGSPWLVSDFVSIGSPLTHAQFLMTKDEDDLEEQRRTRILPTCPPALEWDRHTGEGHFTFRTRDAQIGATDDAATKGKADNPGHFRTPHHAAHFAYTRWTNVYSQPRLVFWGDIVSGAIGAVFGLASRTGGVLRGVRDVKVLPKGKAIGGLLTHLKYWRVDPKDRHAVESVAEVRTALNLLDKV